jgi:hypothetical protein
MRLLHTSGTLGDGFARKNTKKTTWPDAEAVAEAWESAGVWSSTPTIAAHVTPDDSRVTIEDALA